MTLSFGAAGVLDRIVSKVVPSYTVKHVWGENFTVDEQIFIPLIRYRSVSFEKSFTGTTHTGGGYTSVEPVGFLTTKDGQPFWIGFLSDQKVEKGLLGMHTSGSCRNADCEKEKR